MDYSICMYILPYSYSVHALVVYCTLLFSVLWTKENIIRFRWSMKKIHWWFHLVYPPIYLELGGLPAHSARSSPPFNSFSTLSLPHSPPFSLPLSYPLPLSLPHLPHLSSFIFPSSPIFSSLSITLPSSLPLPLSPSLFSDQKLQFYAEQPN